MVKNMMKNNIVVNIFAVLFALIMVTVPKSVLADSMEYKKFSTKEEVHFNKVWTVTMSRQLKPNTVNSENIQVTDALGNYIDVKVSLGEKDNLIVVEPPAGGYEFGQTYSLLVSGRVESEQGGKLKESIKTVFTIEESPRIDFFRLEHEPFISGDKLTAFITTQLNRDVQYNVFLYDKKTKKHTNITQGYSQSVKGNEPFLVTYDKVLQPGEYRLKAYIKRAEVKGIKKDSRTDYDNVKNLDFTVLEKNYSEYIDINGDVELNGNNYEQIEAGYSYKIGEKISIDKIQNISGKGEGYKYKLNAYNLTNPLDINNITKYGDKLEWIPPEAGEYILEVWVKSYEKEVEVVKDQTVYDSKKLFYVNVYNKQFIYVDYDMTLEEFIEIESAEERAAISWVDGEWKRASEELVEYYATPENFMDDDYGMYQFLTLNYIEGITEEDLDMFLEGRGILDGKGAAFLEAAKKNNVSQAYLVAHSILETGHGKSELANGIKVSSVDGKPVEPKVVYNMYAAGAYDADPNKLGSEFAYKQGWFTPEKAIIEGAAWIGERYINSEKYHQNTLYKMRWNVEVPWHQYATDVRWAYNQIKRIEEYVEKSKKAFLVFEIPRFKEK